MDFPLWFGPEDRSLFATASVPDDGTASGAVVLCPPLGLEAVCARRTFQALSRALAEKGILALRFDYDGLNDSAGGSNDSNRLAAWVGSVHRAIDLAHQSGASKVAVVGMRLGATLAAAALGDADGGGRGRLVDGLVLWDPCATGRSYLRAQRALHFFSVDESDQSDGSVEAPGVVFSAETVAELSSLDLGTLKGSLAQRILVVARAVQPDGKAALERFVAARPVERIAAHGQERLIDVEPFAAEVPWPDVEAVTTWLSDTLAGERTDVSVPRREVAVVGTSDAGPIVECLVSLGPNGLFGVVTEPQGAGARGAGPTAVFLNAGVIDHTGPARLWVDLGRRWAEKGVRSVRCDLSGLGDSPPRRGQPPDVFDPPDALDDVLDIAAAASPNDPSDVVLVGLCSGGYHAIEGALALGARGICAVNPVLPSKPSELRADGLATTEGTDARRQAAPATRWWIRVLPAHNELGALLNRMPNQVWWLLNRVAVERSPARVLRRLVDQGVRTLIVSGEGETVKLWRGESRVRRQLELSGGLRQVVVPGIDHELFKRHARDLVSEIVTDDVLRTYAPQPLGSTPGGPR